MKNKVSNKSIPKWLGIFIFLLGLVGGGLSKIYLKPKWSKDYSAEWSEQLGNRVTDISYGKKDSNKFDLYLPKDKSKEHYGLVVYIHGGGFTRGDKSDDKNTLAYFCKKGYVAAGVNYSLGSDKNDTSVLSESNEIKHAIPEIVKEAKKEGYDINKMAIGGYSAGHALSMLYAYRDSNQAPVPLLLTFGAVGPSSFHVEDWGVLGAGKENGKSINNACKIFGDMAGEKITPQEILDGSYQEKMKPISAEYWVSKNPIPTVVAYGAEDKIQPFEASKRLEKALRENDVDYKYYVLAHSGHALQNDSKIMKEWMDDVNLYLDKYMPVN